tara:strand:- start:236 stop:484 length:249 start_codon:yes stop_codon:yes gene_type:complete
MKYYIYEKVNMPRKKTLTEEEAKERQRMRAREYQKKRYGIDESFREKRKEHSNKTYNESKIKLQQKLDRLEELEKLLKETTP